MPSLDEFFERMPEAIIQDKTQGINATMQFDLTGEGGGQYYLNIYEGMADTGKGRADNVATTVHMGAEDFKNMMSGKLNPMQAYMNGKIKVDGSLLLMQQFIGFFDFGWMQLVRGNG